MVEAVPGGIGDGETGLSVVHFGFFGSGFPGDCGTCLEGPEGLRAGVGLEGLGGRWILGNSGSVRASDGVAAAAVVVAAVAGAVVVVAADNAAASSFLCFCISALTFSRSSCASFFFFLASVLFL